MLWYSMKNGSGARALQPKLAPASPVHAASRSELHQSQGQEEFLAIADGNLLQSILHTEQGI
jgi:hypothetical protein